MKWTSWPRGVTVSTLDSESSDRGSNPREASSTIRQQLRVGRAENIETRGEGDREGGPAERDREKERQRENKRENKREREGRGQTNRARERRERE